MAQYSAGRTFWRLAWPASLEGLVVMLLFSVDLLMVSGLGTAATSAVGIFGQPQMVILCVARSFGIAVSALISTLYGRGETGDLSACLKQAFVLMTLAGAVLMAASLAFLEPILSLAGARTEYMSMALSYAKPAMIALFFTGLTTILGAGLLAVGRTVALMTANIIGNIVNVICNALLIYGMGPFPRLGVRGAGYATLIGAAAAFLMTLGTLMSRNGVLTLRGRKGWRFQAAYLRELWQIFTGAFAEQGVERIGMFLYSRMVAELGTLPFAVHTICMNLCNLYYSFAQGMGKASLVLAGRTVGAGDSRAFDDTARAGQRIGFLLSGLAFVLYIVFRHRLLGLYGGSPEVVALGGSVMLLVAVVSFPEAHSLVCAGTLRGAGKTRYVAAYSLVSIALVRPLLTWFLCFTLGLGLYGAWISLFIDQSTRAICAWIGVNKTRRAFAATT